MGTRNDDCTGTHHYFVADVVGIQTEGKVCVVIVCTACGDIKINTIKVSEPNAPMTIEKRKES